MTTEQTSKADAVAAYFKLPLQQNESSWQRLYSLPDGGSLSFTDDRSGKGKRLSITAYPEHELGRHRPSYYNGDKPATHISVSMDKSPETIARDIKHRLMPGYKQLVADCRKNHETAQARLTAEIDLLLCVAKPFGRCVQTSEHNQYEVQPVRINRAGLELTAKERYDGTVTIEIDCTAQIAGLLAEFLANLCPAFPPKLVETA